MIYKIICNVIFSLVLSPIIVAYAQGSGNVIIQYDASGNRISRNIIIFKTPVDSIISQQDTVMAETIDTTAFNNDLVTNHEDNNSGNPADEEIYLDNIGGSKISVYPNPTSGMLSVQITPFSEGLKAEISLFDFANKLLFKTTCSAEYTRLNLSSYPAGTYLMYVAINGRVSNWKIVKQ